LLCIISTPKRSEEHVKRISHEILEGVTNPLCAIADSGEALIDD